MISTEPFIQKNITKDSTQTTASNGSSNLFLRALLRDGTIIDQRIREGRVQRSFALLTGVAGLFTGLEVLYEHLKGSYNQRIMYTPLILSFALFGAGVWGAFSKWGARIVLRAVSLLTMLDGVVGFFFHIRGIQRKPGGWRIPIVNLVMGPPISAPLLVSSVGFLGLITSFLRRENTNRKPSPIGTPERAPRLLRWVPGVAKRDEIWLEQNVREGRFQRTFAIVTVLMTFLSGIEALYSHYQNNFAYRVQWTPIIVTPLLMITGIGALWSRTIARIFLPIASAIAVISGTVGCFFHARGIRRRPGGLKKPLYNIMYGPPILAPLMFAACGMVGIITGFLRREKAREQ